MTHPLRFGIISIQDKPWHTLVEHWKLVESLGYDSLWTADHFVNPYKVHGDWFDGWMVLAGMASATSTIRIGPLVSNIILRNPAVLARQAMTLDHLSNGRLELGIGATSDHDPSQRMTGVEDWTDGERAGRFGEFVEIVDEMLTHEVTSFEGRYYNIREAQMHPATLQKPRPPLTIAAAGKNTLKVAARHGDTWNTYGGARIPAQEALTLTRQRGEMLDEHCAALGRDPKSIRRSFLCGFVTDPLFASVDAFHDFIGRYRELGFSEFIFYYDYPLPEHQGLDRAMLEKIGSEVIPALSAL